MPAFSLPGRPTPASAIAGPTVDECGSRATRISAPAPRPDDASARRTEFPLAGCGPVDRLPDTGNRSIRPLDFEPTPPRIRKVMKMKTAFLALSLCVAARPAPTAAASPPGGFTDSFFINKSDLSTTGRSRYFVLEPGFRLVLEGREGGTVTVLTITVLNEIKKVDGVETRVVEERETENGEVTEVSRNYFAMSRTTGDVFYFGEDVDIYKNGKIADHEGAWLSGVNGARFGLMLPGAPTLGARYQQEVAPNVAMDRAEVVSLTETLETPAGRFVKCLKIEETSALEGGKAYKLYAPSVGLILDGRLKLTKHGRAGP